MLLEGMALGRYQLVRLLGSGGMGEVYLGEDTHIHRQVAVKVTRAEVTPYPNSSSAKETERLFRREVRAIAMLDHPYILPLFDYGEQTMEDTSLTYMVMPYCKEGSLSTWLRQHSNAQMLTLREVVHIIRQAASALAYAHSKQIVHQDVKPSNFLVRSNDLHPDLPDLLLADFGIAKFTSASASMSQSSRGTPTYMAPEQWGGRPVAASDQYALAIMTYQLLTGSPPFQGRQEQVMYLHFNEFPQPPSTRNPAIPKDVDTVILRALAKKPEERFGSITAFAAALQQASGIVEQGKATNPLPYAEQPRVTNVRGAMQTPSRPLTHSGDIRATVAISREEATTGTTRNLNLPGGRRITVPLPSGMPDGQVIRLEGQGETTGDGTTGALVLTIAVTPDETRVAAAHGNENQTVLRSFPGNAQKDAIAIRRPGRVRRLVRSKAGIAISLVLLVVLSGSGFYYFRYFNFLQQWSLLNAGIANPYPPNSGTLVLNDPLGDNSLGYSWTEGNSGNGACTFTGGSYQVESASFIHLCSATTTNFANFAYEVKTNITEGDGSGIVFRVDRNQGTYYLFYVDTGGFYFLYSYSNSQVVGSLVSGIAPGNFGQTHTIAVTAIGSTITLFINGQQVASVNDSSYSQGEIGMAALSEGNPTVVTFSNARVWQL
ncbi:MAG TPA: protein kinase [Ktedonobacteraceae bacterium]|jgi:serine/threonine protein kinase|nr:protein kinase [Ktedonobacteraceae bacterium]